MPGPTALPTAGSPSIPDQLTLSRELQVSHELELRFCGEPGVYRASGDRIPLGRKAMALLAYLHLEPRVHARQQLSGLLWPESDENAAATSLRQALSKLREVLGSKLYTDRMSVSLDPSDSLLQSDVGEFSMLVDSDPLAALQVDIGAFLSQLTVGDAADYDSAVATIRKHRQDWSRCSR